MNINTRYETLERSGGFQPPIMFSIVNTNSWNAALTVDALGRLFTTKKVGVPLAAALCRRCLQILQLNSKEHWRAKTHASGTQRLLLTLPILSYSFQQVFDMS